MFMVHFFVLFDRSLCKFIDWPFRCLRNIWKIDGEFRIRASEWYEIESTYNMKWTLIFIWFVFEFAGTNFCASIVLPTDYTWKKALGVALISVKIEYRTKQENDLDMCCRALHKCDAFKNIQLNSTKNVNIRHCNCVNSFYECLSNVNTSTSNDIASIYSLDKNCYRSVNHPIHKCNAIHVQIFDIRFWTDSVTNYLKEKNNRLQMMWRRKRNWGNIFLLKMQAFAFLEKKTVMIIKYMLYKW